MIFFCKYSKPNVELDTKHDTYIRQNAKKPADRYFSFVYYLYLYMVHLDLESFFVEVSNILRTLIYLKLNQKLISSLVVKVLSEIINFLNLNL